MTKVVPKSYQSATKVVLGFCGAFLTYLLKGYIYGAEDVRMDWVGKNGVSLQLRGNDGAFFLEFLENGGCLCDCGWVFLLRHKVS